MLHPARSVRGGGAAGVTRRASSADAFARPLHLAARRALPPPAARRVDRRGEGSVYDDDGAKESRRLPWAARPPPSEKNLADDAHSGPRAIASPWRPPAAYRAQPPASTTKEPDPPSAPASGPFCVWPWPEDDEDKDGGADGDDPTQPRRRLARAVARRYRSLIGGTGFPIPSAYAAREVDVGGELEAAQPSEPPPPPPQPRRARPTATTPPSPASSSSWLRALVSKARQSWRDQWDVLSSLGGDEDVRKRPRRPAGRPRKRPPTDEPTTPAPPPRAIGRPRKEPLGPKPAPRPRGRPKGSKTTKKDGRPPSTKTAVPAALRAATTASSPTTTVVYHRAPFRAEARRAAADAAAGDPRGGRTLAITFFDDGGGALGAYRGALAAAALEAALKDRAAALAAAGINLRVRVASITRLTPGAPPPPPADPRLVAAAEAAGIVLDPSSTALDPAAPHGADAVVESDLALVMDAYDAEELVREAAGMEAVCPRGAYSRRVRPFGLYASRPGSCGGAPGSSRPLFPASTPDIDDPWTYGGGGAQETWAEAWSFDAAAAVAVAQVKAAAAGLAAHLAADIAGAAVVRAGVVSPRAALAAAGLCPLLTAEADADWRRSVAVPTRRRGAARQQTAVPPPRRRPTITRPPALAVTSAPARTPGWAPLWLEDELPPGAAAMFATVGGRTAPGAASATTTPPPPPILYTLRERRPGAPPRPVRLGRMPSRHWAADPDRVNAAVRAYVEAKGDGGGEAGSRPGRWLPTRAELCAGGASSLSAAMAKVAGGSTALAARTGLRPKRMTPGTWAEEGTLAAALREVAASAGTPGVMPSHAVLRSMGEHRLAHAVRKAGGSAVVAAAAGLAHEPRRGKPRTRAAAAPDAPTLRYLVAAVDPSAVAEGRMPSRASILASPAAARAVTRAGGVKAVAELLGLEFVGAARGRPAKKKEADATADVRA